MVAEYRPHSQGSPPAGPPSQGAGTSIFIMLNTTVQIICDACGEKSHVMQNEKGIILRRELEDKFGWVYSGKDYCKSCSQKKFPGGRPFKGARNR